MSDKRRTTEVSRNQATKGFIYLNKESDFLLKQWEGSERFSVEEYHNQIRVSRRRLSMKLENR